MRQLDPLLVAAGNRNGIRALCRVGGKGCLAEGAGGFVVNWKRKSFGWSAEYNAVRSGCRYISRRQQDVQSGQERGKHPKHPSKPAPWFHQL